MADFNCMVCDVCDRKLNAVEYKNGVAYLQRRTMALHINNMHSEGTPYQCDMCDKGYKTRVFMIDHIKNEHQHQSLFQCDHCGKRMKHRTVIMRHVRKQHGPNGERIPKRRFQCKLCHEKFGTHYYAYRTHMVTAHGRENFVCDYCSLESTWKCDLMRHIRVVHQEQRPFGCRYCPAKFVNLSYLRSHIDSKHKGKFLQCDHCDKLHSLIGNLKIHITAVHMRKKRLPCPLCDVTFAYPQSLFAHKERMHKPIAFQCDLCGKMIKERQQLIYHIARAHTKLSAPIRSQRTV